MKRSLPFIPILFLVFLNACGGSFTTGAASAEVQNAVASTLTAMSWTPTPTQFYNPNITNILNILNADLPVANPLEWTLDAEYSVTDINFLNVEDVPGVLLSIEVRCLCNNENCCIPERTFVVIVDSMKRNANHIVAQVPTGVSWILVVCYDFKTPNGAVYASWDDVKGYLLGYLTGHQLGVRATRTAVP